MKKLFIILLLVANVAHAEKSLKLTMSDANALRVANALVSLYPIPLDAEDQPLYTKQAWVREVTRRWLINRVKHAERKIAQAAVTVDVPNATVE